MSGSGAPGSLRRRLLGSGALGSLRWRLAGWVALVVVLSTGVAFVAVYRGTGTQLRRQIDSEIAGDADELAHALISSGARTPSGALAAARGYIRGQPFDASSTLLFALVPGAGTATNTPELFGAPAPDDGESAAVQAQENRLSRRLLSAGGGYATLSLPDVGHLRLLKRALRIPGGGAGGERAGSGSAKVGGSRVGQQVTIGVGESLASVAHAQRGVARAFILAGLLTLAGALLASLLIGARFSRPLRRMAAVAAQVDAGDLHPRIHDVAREGQEVRVLADAFNHMLDRLTDAFAGQRAFVADASHELRTPLTVIRGQLEVLAAQQQPSGDEVRRVERLVQAEIARVTRLVDDLLLLAKAEHTQFLRLEPVALETFVEELWDGITLLAPRRFELGEVPAGTLLADPDRLAQALRNLIGNAIAHTASEHGLVRLDVERLAPGDGRLQAGSPGDRLAHPPGGGSARLEAESGGRGHEWVRFVVQDDGPGIPAEQRERVFDRFHRTDAARDRASGGTGLGLAIARAIAEAHGGRVAASQSAAGGARIALDLPRFTPAPAPAESPAGAGRAPVPSAAHAQRR
jgi:two-component system, OmpR family, sensor kinase